MKIEALKNLAVTGNQKEMLQTDQELDHIIENTSNFLFKNVDIVKGDDRVITVKYILSNNQVVDDSAELALPFSKNNYAKVLTNGEKYFLIINSDLIYKLLPKHEVYAVNLTVKNILEKATQSPLPPLHKLISENPDVKLFNYLKSNY